MELLNKPVQSFYAPVKNGAIETASQMPYTQNQALKAKGYFKLRDMDNEKEFISRRVRIKFKHSNEVIEGNIIFNTAQGKDSVSAKLLTMIRFRFNNPQKTEALFSMLDIAFIDYL